MNSSSIDGTSTAYKEICISLPPRVNSDGVWISNATSSLTNFSLPLLEMQLIFAFISNVVCYLILNSFGLITKFVSQMMVCRPSIYPFYLLTSFYVLLCLHLHFIFSGDPIIVLLTLRKQKQFQILF